MLARIRKAQEEHEGGFTLIELLVVIIIIGILAAIAIPVFLNQRNKGYDSQAKSDLRNAATIEETYLTDNDVYGDAAALASAGYDFQNSANAGPLVATFVTDQSYCLSSPSASGTTFYLGSTASSAVTTTAC
jgi:type IV pilus assembly protein PilA